MVGDDPVLEMGMARAARAVGVAVTSGLNDHETFASVRAAERPDVILPGLQPLVALFDEAQRRWSLAKAPPDKCLRNHGRLTELSTGGRPK